MVDLALQTEASTPAGEEPLLTEEAATIMTRWVAHDDRASLTRYGIDLTPLVQTFADTLEYLYDIGRLPRG